MRKRWIATAAAALLAVSCLAAEPFFLRRQLSELEPRPDELTAGAKSAFYRPVFGAGDKDAGRLRGIARCGELTVGPGGSSALVSRPAEEQIYYVLEGNGNLLYEERKVAVKKDDFAYLPAGRRHGVENTGAGPLRVFVMGYKFKAGRPPEPAPDLLTANAGDVPLQVLASHGPTTQFKLLLGQTTSKRDRLAASSEVTSLFIMDFAPGGTNIPHSHAGEEEIYLLMRGSGEMVAGKDAEGREARFAATAGAVFLWGPGTRVGYYSGAPEGGEHDLILAVRSRVVPE